VTNAWVPEPTLPRLRAQAVQERSAQRLVRPLGLV
jgi:hypothetical protein